MQVMIDGLCFRGNGNTVARYDTHRHSIVIIVKQRLGNAWKRNTKPRHVHVLFLHYVYAFAVLYQYNSGFCCEMIFIVPRTDRIESACITVSSNLKRIPIHQHSPINLSHVTLH